MGRAPQEVGQPFGQARLGHRHRREIESRRRLSPRADFRAHDAPLLRQRLHLRRQELWRHIEQRCPLLNQGRARGPQMPLGKRLLHQVDQRRPQPFRRALLHPQLPGDAVAALEPESAHFLGQAIGVALQHQPGLAAILVVDALRLARR